MKHTTLAGTFIKIGAEVVARPMNYFLGQSMIIHTNTLPKSFKNNNNSLIDNLKTLDDVLNYYDEGSDIYYYIKGLLKQVGRNNIANVDYRFSILYKEGKNATCSYIETSGLELTNFKPEENQRYKKCVLTIDYDGNIEKRKINIYKQINTKKDLVVLLNDAGFSCHFKLFNGEIQVLSPYLGSGHLISVVASNDDGYEDLAGANYLNLLGATLVEGEDDEGNDFLDDIPTLINQGYPITFFSSTAIVKTATLKSWEEKLQEYSQLDGINKYCPLMYFQQSKLENALLKEETGGQTNFLTSPCCGYGNDNMRLELQGGWSAALCSNDYGENNVFRNDAEWGTLETDSDLLDDYVGLNNADVNFLRENGCGGIAFFSDQYQKIMVMGNNAGWSATERCAFSCLANEAIIAVANNRVYADDKTKSIDGAMSLKSDIEATCNVFEKNGYLTNEAKEDATLNSLPLEVQEMLRVQGYCVYNIRFVDNVVNFDLVVCLRGIISSIKGNVKVLSN